MEPQGNRSLEGIRTYQEFKAATDREVYNQAEGFVRLGYLLRRAEDTDILSESGYKTVTEFAKAEYGLTETYVSRYININKRYSEGGYSDRLMERFQGFGLAKLADMLTLPDGVVEALPVEATRAQIQEVKREVARERQVSDLEILMEPSGGEEDRLQRHCGNTTGTLTRSGNTRPYTPPWGSRGKRPERSGCMTPWPQPGTR